MVMTPEPFGEAFDALGDRRRDGRRADAVRGAVQPGAGPRAVRRASGWCSCAAATRASTSGCSTTPRPGPRWSRSRSATTSSTAARSPPSRSPRRWSGCCPASWATPSRWSRSRTRTGCWSTPSTPGPRRGAASTCPRCCCPATTPRSRPGGSSRPGDVRRSDGPTCCTRASRPPSGRSCPRSRATPASCSPCSGRAGCRRRWPTTASPTSRRCTSRSTTCWSGCGPGRPGWSAARAGWSAPCAAASRRRPAARPGTSAGSWSPPTSRAAGWAGRCSPTSRRSRHPRRDVVPAVHRGPQRRQHPDVQEGRLPGAHRPRGARRSP